MLLEPASLPYWAGLIAVIAVALVLRRDAYTGLRSRHMVRAVSAAETAATTYAWAIHAEALRVRAGRRMAVDGLDLSMDIGVHGLLGPNGAGKTTLVRSIATVLRPPAAR